MPRKNRTEYLKDLVDYFMQEGKVLTRSEYIALGDAAPISYKMIGRFFTGRNYNTVIRLARKQFPVEWASIGSVQEEPVVEPVKKSPSEKKKPAKEPTLSPLDMLRSSKGESSE